MFCVKLIAIITLTIIMSASDARAQNWANIGTVGTLNNNELCYTDGTDIICDAGLFVNGSTALEVSGTVSATAFVGDGSQLTGLDTDPVSLSQIVGVVHGVSSATPYSSLFIGHDAGANNGALTNNSVGVGRNTLSANTTGFSNVAVGTDALQSNTSGRHNTALGHDALSSNTTARDNTALGYAALKDNSTGQNNTAVGSNALNNTTSGDFNTALGGYALRRNSVGYTNTAVGYNTLRYGSFGYENTAIGAEAGMGAAGNADFFHTTLLGYRAGYGLRSGSGRNIFVGHQAGDSVSTGSDNIVIGVLADTSAPTASNELNIGNSLYGDLANDRIGVGIATPLAELDVSGTVSATAFVGDGTSLTGVSATPGGNNGWFQYNNAGVLDGVPFAYSNGYDKFYARGGLNNYIVNHSTGGTYAGRLNIGTTDPSTEEGALHLAVAGYNNSDNLRRMLGVIMIGNRDSVLDTSPIPMTEGDYLPGIGFAGHTTTSLGAETEMAATIHAVVDGTVSSGNLPTAVVVNTGTEASNMQERLRIASSGEVGIGIVNPTTELEVAGTVSATSFVGDGSGLTNVGGLWTDASESIQYQGVNFYKEGSVPSGYSNGDKAFVWHPDKRALAIGKAAYAGMFNDSSMGDVSFAFGDSAIASGNGSFAFGTNARSTGNRSISFGGSASANYAIALQGNAESQDAFSVARYGGAYGQRSIAIGSSGALNGGAQAYGLSSVAIGTGSDAYANYGVAIGTGSSVSGTSAVAFTAARADGLNSIAMGKNAFVSGNNSMVFGLADVTGTEVTDSNTMAILGGQVAVNQVSANAELDVLGTVSATAFVGDGSGLTGIPAGTSLFMDDTSISIVDDGSNSAVIAIDVDGQRYLEYSDEQVAGLKFNGQNAALYTKSDGGFVRVGNLLTNGYRGGVILIGGDGDNTAAYAESNSLILGTRRTNNNYAEDVHFDTIVRDWSRRNMTIDGSSGRVGIGLENPSTTLEVSGTVKANAFIGDGSGLTGVSAGSLQVADTSISIMDSGTGEVHMDVDGERLVTGRQGALDVSGSAQIAGTGSEVCGAAGDLGKMRWNPVSQKFQICRQ
ncbi:MAG: hypothetical protein CMF60_07575 [Magnetococcales bacterium]|nr:hypothetical protein [Magnetococcales bacterium]